MVGLYLPLQGSHSKSHSPTYQVPKFQPELKFHIGEKWNYETLFWAPAKCDLSMGNKLSEVCGREASSLYPIFLAILRLNISRYVEDPDETFYTNRDRDRSRICVVAGVCRCALSRFEKTGTGSGPASGPCSDYPAQPQFRFRSRAPGNQPSF